MENHFTFYDFDELFFLDEKELKVKYIEISKESHPDFYVNDAAAYQEALKKTSDNNVAFKALRSFDRRIEHILKVNGVLQNAKNDIPQAFLMEMMDINEAIMDMKMEPSEKLLTKTEKDINDMDVALHTELTNAAKHADALDKQSDDRKALLIAIKEIYLKRKYVLRIKESLNTFAPL